MVRMLVRMAVVNVIGSDSTSLSDWITSVLRLDLFENQKLRSSSESQNSENDWSCGVGFVWFAIKTGKILFFKILGIKRNTRWIEYVL
jgi:hypothetical protein